MKRDRLFGTSDGRAPLGFFLLVLALSIPVWAVGPLVDGVLPEALTASLPFSSLMAFTPVTAALLMVWREQGVDAAKALLRRTFDYKRIGNRAWYLPTLFIMPAVMILQVGLLSLVEGPPPHLQLPLLALVISFAVFFIAAAGEEVGWQGYAINPLQKRWNALAASVILGTVWAAWHIVPMIQLGRAPAWITWQCLSMVAARILIVWLYNNTGKSVFAAVLFHAMVNVTTVLLPAYGWPYNPFVATAILAAAAAIVTLLWGPSTLASYRFSRPGSDLQPGDAL